MKTQIYLTTLLAFIIQGMVNGQTPGSQAGNGKTVRVLPVLGLTKNKHATVVYTEAKTQTQISQPANPTPHNEVYYNAGSYKELMTQAEELYADAKILRNEAENNSGPQAESYLQQAKILYKQAEQNHLKAAEIAGKTNKEKYRINKEGISAIMLINKGDDYLTEKAKDLIFVAAQNIRMGQEMREEAYAMPTGSAKLGSMVNAVEKENIALKAQAEAIQVLKSANPSLAGSINAILNGTTLAAK